MNTSDLFGYCGDDALLSQVRRYVSGVAAPAIWNGYAAAGVPLCIVAADLPASGLLRALAYRRAGHRLLLDSGAFVYRDRPQDLDWRAVLLVYLALARGEGPRLSMIMLDVVGDQGGSIALAALHGQRLARLVRLGNETLVPMQRGTQSLADYFRRYVAALGFAPGGFAIPSNAAAIPVREFWHDADVTADACEHRGQVGEGRAITSNRRLALQRRVGEGIEQADDTEDPAWDVAAEALRCLFPQAGADELSDLLCSEWGRAEFSRQLRSRLEIEYGPAATAESIEAFARQRFDIGG